MTTPWPAQIERWREQAALECRDIPVDLILAIIAAESGGAPGAISITPSGCADLPTDAGEKKLICQDLGLAQINPKTALFYNDNRPANEPPVTLTDLTGTDERATRQQIRVGAWYFAYNVAKLNAYNAAIYRSASPRQADPNQLKFALAAYGAGFGGLKSKLDQLVASGRELMFENLQAAFPDWAGLKGAVRKWNLYKTHGRTTSKPDIASSSPSWLPVVLTLAAAWILRQYKSAQTPRLSEPVYANPETEPIEELEEEIIDPDEET